MKCKNCSKSVPKEYKQFCSYICFQKYSIKTRRIYLFCKNCKKEYWKKKCDYIRFGSLFCTRVCRNQYGKVLITCPFCKKDKKVFRSRLNSKLQHCSKKCFFEHKKTLVTGKNNPNYRNGFRTLSKKLRNCSRYRLWKKEVLEKDDYKCRGKSKYHSDKLIIHHKIRLWKLIEDYPNKKININDEYFYNLDNGLTLCESCHFTTYGKDDDIIE